MILLKFLNVVPMDAKRSQIDVSEEDLAKIRQEIYDAAELLQRSKIAVSAQEWLEMTTAEKTAMKDVGNMLDAERAVRLVNALLEPEYRAELLAPQDGGRASKELGKAKALAALNAKMEEVGKEFSKRVYLHQ